MNTLFDFVSHTKGIEYLIAIGFIALYALFVEFLKPAPFAGLLRSVKEDAAYIRENGKMDMKRLTKNALRLPFVAVAYMAALPAYFAIGVMLKSEETLARTIGGGSMAWRPLEAYLSGRARKKLTGRKVRTQGKEDAGK